MTTFFTTSAIVAVALLACGIPVFIVAWQRRRMSTIRSFIWLALGLGALAGVIESSSERLVTQCFAAGNPICEDPGGPGLIALLFVTYLILTVARAVAISRR